MEHDPLCGWNTETGCFDPADDCLECAVIARARADERSNNFTPDDFSDAMTGMTVLTEGDKEALRWYQGVQDEAFERGYSEGINEAIRIIENVRKYEWELDGLSISDQVLFDRIIAAVRSESND